MRDCVGENYDRGQGFSDLAALIMARYPLIVFEEIVEKSADKDLIHLFFREIANDDDEKVGEPKIDVAKLLEWVKQDPQARALKIAHVVSYAVRDGSDEQLRWSAIAQFLIDVAVDPVPVLRAFEQRFWVGAGWGPISLRFTRRRPLVTTMLQHRDHRVRTWAREANLKLEENIRRWDEMDRNSDSRFE